MALNTGRELSRIYTRKYKYGPPRVLYGQTFNPLGRSARYVHPTAPDSITIAGKTFKSPSSAFERAIQSKKRTRRRKK